jgi:hypothetical protein
VGPDGDGDPITALKGRGVVILEERSARATRTASK